MSALTDRLEETSHVKFKLLSIDAWRDMDGWYWNNYFTIEDDIYISEDLLTPRRIARMLREWAYLNQESIGKIRIDMHNELCDGWLIEILDKNNQEPIFALSTIH